MIFNSMKRSALFILILNTISVSPEVMHEAVITVGCFKTGTPELQFAIDDGEIFYVDYERQEIKYSVPKLFVEDPSKLFDEPHIMREAVRINDTCSTVLSFWDAIEKHPPEEIEPPVTTLYTADEVQLRTENTLICFINHFHPPNITVRWTKNGHPVSDGISLSRYYPNNDQTFHQFSTLNFTPSKVDMYSCVVEHVGLENPITKIWEPELPQSSHGADIFLGISLTVGLLFATAGIALLVNGHKRR